MTKESREIEEFWQEREKEYGSTRVIATAAAYISGCPEQRSMHGQSVHAADSQLPPVNGLLYILHNGIYFENFPNTHMFSTLFRLNEQFVKVKLVFKKENIISVSCNRPRNFIERLSLFFSDASRQFIITHKHSGQIQNVIFDCLHSPLLLCDAYNSIKRQV